MSTRMQNLELKDRGSQGALQLIATWDGLYIVCGWEGEIRGRKLVPIQKKVSRVRPVIFKD
jgi:hypothetical protein